MKIVADTNVLISALLWKKNLESFSELINSREITLCFSPKTAEELYRVANYPHILKKAYENNFNHISVIDIIIENSFLVYPEFLPNIVKDPADNNFLACAISARADFIISGDKHLLKLKSFQNIPILTPRQFLNSVHPAPIRRN